MANTTSKTTPKKISPKTKPKAGKPITGHAHDHTCDCHKFGVNEMDIQKVLAKANKPLSAYDLMPLLAKQKGHEVAPMTVYRALNHLGQHGIVTRIESQNAYILCQHPQEDHDCLFFICRNCGTATEAPDGTISKLLRKEAAALGFGIKKQILEVIGLCKKCVKEVI